MPTTPAEMSDRELLMETHDSTIRQEEVQKQHTKELVTVVGRLDFGDNRFHSLEGRVDKIDNEQQAGIKRQRNILSIAATIFGAMCVPFFAWLWEVIIKAKKP